MPSRAGSPNRNKQFLLKRLQDMYGEDFHPIMKMAENAVKLQELADEIDEKAAELRENGDIKPTDVVAVLTNHTKTLNTSLEAWEKIAQYTEPKLKAVEVSGNEDAPLAITKIELVPLSGDSES